MREYAGSTAYAVSTEKLFAPSTVKESIITVGAGVTEILPNNPRRLSWHICNRGVAPVYFGFSGDVTTANGFFLDANGGFASMSLIEDGETTGYAVYAVSASGNATLRVLEVYTL